MKHTPIRRRSRTVLVAVATAAVGALVFSGCTAAGGDSGGDVKGQTISYWLWDTNQQPAYQQCADDFEKQSGVKVEISQYGWADYWQKITTGFASGTAPDTFADHLAYYPQFVSQGQLTDITDRVAKDKIDLSQYQDGLAELWVKDGKRYGLPKDFDTVGYYYNSDMVSAAGLTDDDMKKLEWNTTDGGSFEKAVAALTVDKNGKHGNEAGFDKNNVAVYGLSMSINGLDAAGQTAWSLYALSNGWYYGDTSPWTSKWNYDDPKLLEALKFYRSLIEKGYMESVEQAASESDPATAFLGGKFAIVTDGDWMNSTYLGQDAVKVKVAPSAVGPVGHRSSLFNGLSDGIWSGSKKQDAAYQWIKYTGSTACQDVVAKAAVVFPAIKSSTEKAIAQFDAKGWDVTGFTAQVTDKTTALLPIADHWSDVQAIMQPLIQGYLSGKSTDADFATANDQVNALFK
ncbi:MAG: ABC transporter substrate-binding protein [Leifsonia xyli]|nr:MAG: ABC transporter substrate-binding protein [Leifsonia xyli]